MYTYTLPTEQFEINEAAKKLEELHPGITVEFGYDNEVATTVVIYIHHRVLYAYTHTAFRRQGAMSTHLKNLIKRGLITAAVVATSNVPGQMMLLKSGLKPNNFITPLISTERHSTHRHMVYTIQEDTLVSKLQVAESPFHAIARDWVEKSIIIEQFPTSL